MARFYFYETITRGDFEQKIQHDLGDFTTKATGVGVTTYYLEGREGGQPIAVWDDGKGGIYARAYNTVTA